MENQVLGARLLRSQADHCSSGEENVENGQALDVQCGRKSTMERCEEDRTGSMSQVFVIALIVTEYSPFILFPSCLQPFLKQSIHISYHVGLWGLAQSTAQGGPI